MEMSDQVGELFAALAKAQGVMANPAKDSTNPHFKSKYADLAEVINSYRKPLSDNGLALIQLVEYLPEPDGSCLTTMLGHSSGQYIKSRMKLVISKLDNQGVGTSITYLRRYSAASILSIAQEDRDGEEEVKPFKKKAELVDLTSFQESVTPVKTLSAEQVIAVMELAPVDSPLYTEICRTKKIADITQFPADNFDKLVAYLRSKQE